MNTQTIFYWSKNSPDNLLKTEYSIILDVFSDFKSPVNFILVDENTRKFCLPTLFDKFPFLKSFIILEINSGEENKNSKTCNYLWDSMLEKNADKDSLLINLGGGAICDIGGFVASTFKRGIKFINIPTTLVAMVDAAFGGKTGIDLSGVKNQIGLFSLPDFIFVDTNFLNTLPEKHLKNGLAEIVKMALITENHVWEDLKTNLIFNYTPQLIQTIAHNKVQITNIDPFEKGYRKILNFGHTIGHAFESFSLKYNEQPLYHGECIAAGMICESWLSQKYCGLKKQDFKEIEKYLLSHFPFVKFKLVHIREIISLMSFDKKNSSGTINFSLLNRPGKPITNIICGIDDITESLHYYLKLSLY